MAKVAAIATGRNQYNTYYIYACIWCLISFQWHVQWNWWNNCVRSEAQKITSSTSTYAISRKLLFFVFWWLSGRLNSHFVFCIYVCILKTILATSDQFSGAISNKFLMECDLCEAWRKKNRVAFPPDERLVNIEIVQSFWSYATFNLIVNYGTSLLHPLHFYFFFIFLNE